MNRVIRIAGTTVVAALAAVLVVAAVGAILAIGVGVARGMTSGPASSAPTEQVPAAVPLACWDEPNTAMPNGLEPICGPVGAAPADSINFRPYPR